MDNPSLNISTQIEHVNDSHDGVSFTETPWLKQGFMRHASAPSATRACNILQCAGWGLRACGAPYLGQGRGL